MKVLVTGTAGFIGYHLATSLLKEGIEVLGVDIINDYYDVRIKERRNSELLEKEGYKFFKEDISNFEKINEIIKSEQPEMIVHLAAQAGVRYSISNPWAYETANNLATLNVLESAKQNKVRRVIFASSSSVYGANKKVPYSEEDRVDNPISIYAATKKANEVLAHSYHHLYGMEIAGLRFFTVYGPMGRPDMALFKFAKNILREKPIHVYNNGEMARDFTFVDDIVAGIKGVMNKPDLKYEIYNLGGDNSVPLMKFIELIEQNLGKKAIIEKYPMQPGDVKASCADVNKARAQLGFDPKTGIEEGVKIFCDWFVDNQDWLLELRDVK